MGSEDRLPYGSHQVVIIGGGFGGLNTARCLKNAPVRVTLIDRRNFHLFQPLLYQVATGALSPANIAAPLRAILKSQRNAHVLLGEATDIDIARRRVIVGKTEVRYDSLIVATGARHHYFGNEGWEGLAPGLKTVEDATEIRRRILLAFEGAEQESDPEKRRAWLTFVIVGGGATGVELAGALGELAHHTLRSNLRAFEPTAARIILVEGTERILPTYPATLSTRAAAALVRLGVTPRTGAMVTEVKPDEVIIKSGGSLDRIATHTVLWAAGVKASPLGLVLSEATGAVVDRVGRVIVEPDLSLPGHPEIFVIGDLALVRHQTSAPLPGVAPVAIQQGRYVATLLKRRQRGEGLPPFRYRDYGNLATIGRAAAVADFGRIQFSGYFAWLAWLFVHLMNLVQFEHRLLVFLQWLWNYLTRNRSARLITSNPPPP
jgi:NADH dehydrogenase